LKNLLQRRISWRRSRFSARSSSEPCRSQRPGALRMSGTMSPSLTACAVHYPERWPRKNAASECPAPYGWCRTLHRSLTSSTLSDGDCRTRGAPPFEHLPVTGDDADSVVLLITACSPVPGNRTEQSAAAEPWSSDARRRYPAPHAADGVPTYADGWCTIPRSRTRQVAGRRGSQPSARLEDYDAVHFALRNVN
jgi:hypothetical protein